MKITFQDRGQSLIGIIIVLIVVSLISGGLYYYLSKQIPEVPEITGKPTEGEIVKLEKDAFLPEEPEEIVLLPEEVSPEEIEPEIVCQNECFLAGTKECYGNGYRVCGSYDTDSCLEWSLVAICSLNTTCQNGACIQRTCSDGTPDMQCSVTKPLYCQNFKLVDVCMTCDCPDDMECQQNNSCTKMELQENEVFLIAPNVFVVKDYGTLRESDGTVDRRTTLKKFYQYESDVYDFISIYPQFETQTDAIHDYAQNFTEGIGHYLFNRTKEYGSKGKLLGMNVFKEIDYYFDDLNMVTWATGTLVHETGHQWLARVGKELGLLEPPGWFHWHGDLNLHWDPMFGKDFVDLDNDGKYDVLPPPYSLDEVIKRKKFSSLSQYLMGLIPSKNVPPIEIFEYHDWPLGYFTLKDVVSIEEIIALEGNRIPTSIESQKSFRMAFILLIENGGEATEESKKMIKEIAESFPVMWLHATDGRSIMNADF